MFHTTASIGLNFYSMVEKILKSHIQKRSETKRKYKARKQKGILYTSLSGNFRAFDTDHEEMGIVIESIDQTFPPSELVRPCTTVCFVVGGCAVPSP